MAKKRASRKTPAARGTKIPQKYLAAVEKARKAAVGAQVWKPEEDGDAVCGKLLSANWREGRGENAKPYCNLLIDCEPQPVVVRPGAVLAPQLIEAKVRIGAELVIVYRGTAPSGFPGRPAKLMALDVVKNGTGDLVYPEDSVQEPVPNKPKGRGRKKA